MASEGNTHPTRNWRDVATELSSENNSSRIAELSKELLRAIDAEKPQPQQINAPSQSQKRAAC